MGITPEQLYQKMQQDEEEGRITNITGETMEGNWEGFDIHTIRATKTRWFNLNLIGMQASQTHLRDAIFSSCTMGKTNFHKALMYDVQVSQSHIQDAIFKQAILSRGLFTFCHVQRTHFGGAVMPGITMRQSDLTDAVFQHSILPRSLFEHCPLVRTDFQNTDCAQSSFMDCRCLGTNFSHANLTNVCFTGSTFEGVDLAYADLTGVCITREQLKGANLLHIRQCFETICGMRTPQEIRSYQDLCLRRGRPYSLPTYMKMPLVPNGPAEAVELFTHGLIPKKNKQGEIDPAYRDQPVRMILCAWIENWLRNK